MSDVLEVKEGIQQQTSGEAIVYKVDVTAWEASPTSPTVKVIDEEDGADVTTTVMPAGNPGAPVGAIITLQKLQSLTVSRTYRVQVKFLGSGNTFEPYFRVQCTF